MAVKDFNYIHEKVLIYKHAYDTQFSVAVDTALHYIDAFHSDMRNIDSYLSFVDNIEAGWHLFHNVQGTAVSLFLSVNAVRKLEPSQGLYKDWPSDLLWRNGDTDNYELCQSQYSLLLDNITRIMELLNQVLVNWGQINQTIHSNNRTIDTWSSKLHEYNGHVNSGIALVKRCSNEYKTVIDGAHEEIESTVKAMEETLQNDFIFSYDELIDSISDDLDTIEFIIAYFEELLGKYSKNETTKLDMYSTITQANRTQLGGALSSILARIDTHAVEPLQTMMGTSKINIRKWLLRCLRAFAKLAPYHNSVRDEIGGLLIWHYPVLLLDSPDILLYRIRHPMGMSSAQNKRPQDKSPWCIVENKEDDTLFREILRYYAGNLSAGMYDFKVKLTGLKKDTMAAFDSLSLNVHSFRKKSQIDKDFIL